MDILILDDDYKPIEIIDSFFSLVWTERHYLGIGDFEMDIESTENMKNLLTTSRKLGCSLSPRIMVVETIGDTYKEGVRTLSVTGRSIENILTGRAVVDEFIMMEDHPGWVFKDSIPLYIVNMMIKGALTVGRVSHDDDLEHYIWGPPTPPIYHPDTIEFPQTKHNMEFEPMQLSEGVSKVFDINPEMGFRMYRDPNNPQRLHCETYTGVDRTLLQTTSPAMVFSLPWGSLENTSDLTSISDYYNAAYVFAKNGVAQVNLSPKVTGIDRRVLVVKVGDSDELAALSGPPLQSYLVEKGEEALKEKRRIALMDGEAPKLVGYEYGKDYNLGDLVTLVGVADNSATMRVTEHIYTVDESGLHSYPTLAMVSTTTPGTWSSLLSGEVWATMPGYWADA